MKRGYKNFAMLCESIILNETSTVIDVLKRNSAEDGVALGKFLHDKHMIPHDAKVKPVTKISKESGLGDRIYLVMGTTGSAALIAPDNSRREGSSYTVLLPKKSWSAPVTDLDPDQLTPDNSFLKLGFGTGETAINEIKKHVGKIRNLYVVVYRDNTNVSAVQIQRQQRKQELYPTSVEKDPEKFLLSKFSPLFVRLLAQMKAEIKGMIHIQLKSESYEKIKEKLKTLKYIESLLLSFEKHGKRFFSPYVSGELTWEEKNLIDGLQKLMYKAITLTLYHNYPDIVGDMPDDYVGARTGQQKEKEAQARAVFLTKIKEGNTPELATLMQFFKILLLRSKWIY